jgi:hypothetical protein
MSDSIAYLLENKEALIQILTGVVTIASIIATMTPNDSDNAFVAKLNTLVSWLALNIGHGKSK